MCGITGVVSFKGRPIDRSLLKRMNDLLTHRGPDAEGFFLDRHVGLAMRRLKVIDLSTGDQPIHNADKSLWIIFNGEIYNYRELRAELEKKGHRFYTHSDTEVILHQYMEEGESCVRSLIGMFAFAIYDVKRDALFVGRDRLGIKPFFYHIGEEGFVFGSEIKSILEVPWAPKEPDPQAISHYLSLNYLPPPLTPFRNILQLEPGHTARIENGKMNIRPYWDIPLEAPLDVSEGEALKKIEGLLHRSIERRLIADVPVGAFLSGGMDSSTLVALMKDHKHEAIKTFSVGFDEPSYDETPYAEEVAKYFGTDHHAIRCRPRDVIDHLPKIAWHADGLLADQAALPLYIVSELAKKHVTVALSGDGGDETFVGYKTFHADRYHRIYSGIPRPLRKGVLERAVRMLPASGRKLSFEYQAKKFVEAGDFPAAKAHYWWRTIFTDLEKRELLRPEFSASLDLDAYPLYGRFFDNAASLEFGAQALYADLKVWLAGNNLCKVDTMTMAHGLEARVPFLDHELVEYMSRLPMKLKFRGNTLKYLLKKLMRRKLPATVLNRPKAGWHAPIGQWFKGPLKEYVGAALAEKDSPLYVYLNYERVLQVIEEHQRGRYNHTFKIWGLLVLKHWMDRFFHEK